MSIDYQNEMRSINEEQRRWQSTPELRDTHYYPFEDDNRNQVIAALIVILDEHGRSSRAELHLYNPQSLQAQDAYKRRAQNILASRYQGVGPSTELYVMDSTQSGMPILVTNQPTEQARPSSSFPLWPIIAVIGLIILMILGGMWAFDTITTRMAARPEPTPTIPMIVATATAAGEVAGNQLQPALSPRVDPALLVERTNDLPQSQRADPNIRVGSRVRIQPQLRSFVRTEPGSTAGNPVTVLTDGDTATVLGGPVWLEGDSDTIVWWYVEVDNAARDQGWTPANTSSLTLLNVVQ